MSKRRKEPCGTCGPRRRRAAAHPPDRIQSQGGASSPQAMIDHIGRLRLDRRRRRGERVAVEARCPKGRRASTFLACWIRPPVVVAGHPSAGFPATAGSLRGFPADSRAGSARDGKKPAVVMSNTSLDLQSFYENDGTRTRDLRRDRPTRAQRRPAANASEPAHLQALFAPMPRSLCVVEPIFRPTFWATSGPRNLVFMDNAAPDAWDVAGRSTCH
jgi:hypothetical protein